MTESNIHTLSMDAAPRDEPTLLKVADPVIDQTLFAREKSDITPPNNPTTPSKKPLSFYLTFLALNLSVLLVSLDATALPVAVAVITRDLNGTTLEAFWAGICFLLAVVSVMPIITSLSDGIGRKIPLYISFVFLLVGSIVFANAQNMTTLIIGRVLQGLGGGGLDVLGEVILADITTLKERPLYLGIFSVPMAAGVICGPIVGAGLAEYASWRWIGWINLPLGVISLLLFIFFLHLKLVQSTLAAKMSQLDWIGAMLFLMGSTLFSLPLSWAGALYPWTSFKTILPFVLGIVILVLFAFYEARPARPVFPYRIFRSRTALSSLVGAFAHGAVLNGGLFYMLLTFQAIFQDTPFRSAVQALPSCVFIVVFSVLGAIGVEILRRYRLIILAAWPCLAVGIGLFALFKTDSSAGLKYGAQVLVGVGLGILFTVLTFPMNACQHVDDAGLATGIMVSFRMFGSMVGLALGSTVFNNVFARRIAQLTTLPSEFAQLHDVRTAVAFIPSLRYCNSSIPDYDAVIDCYRVSLTAVFFAFAGIGAVGFVSSLFIKELSLESDEVGRQRFEGA